MPNQISPDIDWRLEDRLTSIHASLEHTSRTLLAVALKGRCSDTRKLGMIASLEHALHTVKEL